MDLGAYLPHKQSPRVCNKGGWIAARREVQCPQRAQRLGEPARMQRYTRRLIQCSNRASPVWVGCKWTVQPQTGLAAARYPLCRAWPEPGLVSCRPAHLRVARLHCAVAALTELPLMTLLIVTSDDAPAQAAGLALLAELQAAGLPALAALPCHMLVRDVVRLAPQAVVALNPGGADGLDPRLQAALALLAATAPLPVVVLGGACLPEAVVELLDIRVMAWLSVPPDLAALRAALALAAPRFAREQALQQDLQAVLARLDERKWVDRAKGVLMQHQQLSEDDAFALLRTASMQANLRVGEVSRKLIEAAAAADAVNRAGQLRMLSQRCVKALAVRTAAAAGAPRGRPQTDDSLAETLQRLQVNLDKLAELGLPEPAALLLAGTRAAGQALTQLATLAGAAPRGASAVPSAATLQEADLRAEALLDQADALTAAMEAASGRRSLQVLNLCGRQRMLSQRLAKQALLAGLLPDAGAAVQAAAAAQTVRDFEAGLAALEQAPLATDAIRAALAQARGQWLRLLDGLRRAASPEVAAGRLVLVRESEALLLSFEQLASLYAHSLQVLLS